MGEQNSVNTHTIMVLFYTLEIPQFPSKYELIQNNYLSGIGNIDDHSV